MKDNHITTPEEQVAQKETLTRKEKRQLWKAAKQERRQSQKEFYRYAPWPRRVWGLYLKVPVAILLVVAIIAVIIYINRRPIMNYAYNLIAQVMFAAQDYSAPDESELEAMREESPLDEAGAAKIDALSPCPADETWTICVYMVGSNLEDWDEDRLSDLTAFEADREKEQKYYASCDRKADALERYKSELAQNELELPAFFYRPTTPVEKTLMDDIVISGFKGAATADLEEITSGRWSDRIRVVIQTGGARKWDNDMINPNRTQRFLYHNGRMKEVYNAALEESSDPDTLAGFIDFCDKEYPSDHRMLVLWNHGGGPFGYGCDSIYGGMMSLDDIRTALESVYEPDAENAPFDVIGFDACLMSTIEVTHALYGFVDYLCVSEEVEPGDGWDYGPWLQAMTDDPSIHPAKVGQNIADSFIDYYMLQGIHNGGHFTSVTFSVIDTNKAEELYQAYSAFAQTLLKDAADDLSVLAYSGRCANRSTRYAGEAHDILNTIDLGNYVDLMIDEYPEECSAIRSLIDEAVLYHRQNGSCADSTGIAVYYPAEVDTFDGLSNFLKYVYDVCEDENVATLYYYKQAGCLTDDMKEYLASMTEAQPETLDVTDFRKFANARVKFDDEGFMVPISDTVQDMIVDHKLELIRYDRNEDKMTELGMEKATMLDGEGFLKSDFDGRWVHLNGNPLCVEVVSATDSSIEYKAHVLYEGEEAYLLIERDRDTDELTFEGIRKTDTDTETMAYNRSKLELEEGASIEPLYIITDLKTGESETAGGEKVTYSDRTELTLEPLKDGRYLMSAVISDQRGDNYYSAVFGATADDGVLSEWRTEPDFYARDYE
ncbi:MAG: hypothetical protein J5518_10835 [Lachnospiraceae bacterium]|nr:hypothetical protein [Lachnospiraceae bacterium]